MYLETIYVLSLKSSYVRSIDVGDYMGHSKLFTDPDVDEETSGEDASSV